MVTEKYKKDDIIDITTNSSISGCTTWQPGCSIASVNSYKHFWFSSGSITIETLKTNKQLQEMFTATGQRPTHDAEERDT